MLDEEVSNDSYVEETPVSPPPAQQGGAMVAVPTGMNLSDYLAQAMAGLEVEAHVFAQEQEQRRVNLLSPVASRTVTLALPAPSASSQVCFHLSPILVFHAYPSMSIIHISLRMCVYGQELEEAQQEIARLEQEVIRREQEVIRREKMMMESLGEVAEYQRVIAEFVVDFKSIQRMIKSEHPNKTYMFMAVNVCGDIINKHFRGFGQEVESIHTRRESTQTPQMSDEPTQTPLTEESA